MIPFCGFRYPRSVVEQRAVPEPLQLAAAAPAERATLGAIQPQTLGRVNGVHPYEAVTESSSAGNHPKHFGCLETSADKEHFCHTYS